MHAAFAAPPPGPRRAVVLLGLVVATVNGCRPSDAVRLADGITETVHDAGTAQPTPFNDAGVTDAH